MAGNDSLTKLLLHCDGADASTTFTDASVGGAHGNATVNGNAQVDTGQSKFGGASYQGDGSGDYLEYATHADWNFGGVGAGDFTIDMWFRYTSSLASFKGVMSAVGDVGTSGWAFYHYPTQFAFWNGASESVISYTPAADTWIHYAIVRSGSVMTFYADGVSKGTFTDADMNNDGNAVRIGIYANTAAASLNGWLDEIRISKGIARWTSNFTPPTAAYDSTPDSLPWSERFEEFKGKKAFTDAPAYDARSIPAVGVQGVAWSQRSEPFYGVPIKFTTPQAFGQEPPTLIKGMGWFTDHDTWRPLRPFDFTSPIGAAFGPVWVATPAAEFTGTRLPLYRRGSSYWKGRT